MASSRLTEAATAMLKEPIVATFVTLYPDGSPHMTPTWIDVDGGDVIVNTTSVRQKVTNIRRNGTVGVSLIDPANPFRVLSLSGTVADIVEDGADEHIDELTMRYMGLETHPFEHPGEVRVMLRIRPERVLVQPS